MEKERMRKKKGGKGIKCRRDLRSRDQTGKSQGPSPGQPIRAGHLANGTAVPYMARPCHTMARAEVTRHGQPHGRAVLRSGQGDFGTANRTAVPPSVRAARYGTAYCTAVPCVQG